MKRPVSTRAIVITCILILVLISIVGCGGSSNSGTTPITSSSPSPSPSPSYLLSDDFESGFNTSVWTYANATPTVVSDPDNSANHVLQIDGAASGKTAYCWSKDESVAPSSLQLKVRMTVAGALDIAFRATNSTKNCYGIQFFSGGSAYFYKMVGQTREYIGKTAAGGNTNVANTGLSTSSILNAWKTLKLVANTDASGAVTLALYVDGTLQKTATYADQAGDATNGGTDGANGDPLTVGGVAVIAYQNTVLIDDVVLQ